MPPQETPPTTKDVEEVSQDTPFPSSCGFKYPPHRDSPRLCADLWLEDKRVNDGAEGLWRVHNKLYDLNTWMDRHPGGRDWIKLTKGTDVTEQFESYHITPEADSILPKFYVRDAKSPRNSPFTFSEDGFYRTLKRRAQDVIKTIPESTINTSGIMTDLLMVGYVSTAMLAAVTNSYLVGMVSGMLLTLMSIASHNFFHQKDNFRMYYFDLSLLSHRDWRISHAMSHHLFPNTVEDLEVSLLQPFFWYLPVNNTFWRRVVACIISPGVWFFIIIANILRKYVFIMIGTIKEVNIKTELLAYTIPMLMYFLGGQSLGWTFVLWLWILCVGSFFFGVMGANAAHHHPELFHDGDTPRSDRDWGLFQLDAVCDRPEINTPFLILVSFGDHVLHHLFPTMDHSKLHYLYPVFNQTCEEFKVKRHMFPQMTLVKGHYAQLLRMEKNPNEPGQKWKWYKNFWQKQKQNFLESMKFMVPKSKDI